jgi:hypothetical protein
MQDKKINLTNMTIDQLVDRFTEIGIAQDEALFHSHHTKFKLLFGQVLDVEKELKSRGTEARESLIRLYSHLNLQIRFNAAKEALAVDPQGARGVVQKIADSELHPEAGDAGMCLWALGAGIFKPD